jgi:hypothetical protein
MMESHTVPNAAKHTGIQKVGAYKDDEQADVEKCLLPWLEHVDSKRNLVVEPHVRQPLPDLHGGRVGARAGRERERERFSQRCGLNSTCSNANSTLSGIASFAAHTAAHAWHDKALWLPSPEIVTRPSVHEQKQMQNPRCAGGVLRGHVHHELP